MPGWSVALDIYAALAPTAGVVVEDAADHVPSALTGCRVPAAPAAAIPARADGTPGDWPPRRRSRLRPPPKPSGRTDPVITPDSETAPATRQSRTLDQDSGPARTHRPGTGLVLATSTPPSVPGDERERAARPAPAPPTPVEAVSQLQDLLDWYDGDGDMRYRDTVADGSHDNGRRAGFAAAVVVGYALLTGQLSDVNDEEPATVFSDLCGDLRHLADSLDLDFAELDDRGDFHYMAELHGDP